MSISSRSTRPEPSPSARRLRVREVPSAYVTAPEPGPLVASPANVRAVVVELFSADVDTRESLYALHLDSRGRLISIEEVARGAINACSASVRDVLTAALVANCSSIVLCHNHPSGDPSPSADDVHFTLKLSDFARGFGIELLDDVIVAASGTVSLRERGVL